MTPPFYLIKKHVVYMFSEFLCCAQRYALIAFVKHYLHDNPRKIWETPFFTPPFTA